MLCLSDFINIIISNTHTSAGTGSSGGFITSSSIFFTSCSGAFSSVSSIGFAVPGRDLVPPLSNEDLGRWLK